MTNDPLTIRGPSITENGDVRFSIEIASVESFFIITAEALQDANLFDGDIEDANLLGMFESERISIIDFASVLAKGHHFPREHPYVITTAVFN